MASAIEVRCFSGHTYAQRPVSFVLEGREHTVQEVQRTWRAPGRVFFAVRTEEGKTFTLEYDEPEDAWRARHAIAPTGPKEE